MPLVGVWIKGARGVDDAAVLAASLRFAYSGALPDKALQGAEAAFLVLLFPAGEAREGGGQGVDGNTGHLHQGASQEVQRTLDALCSADHVSRPRKLYPLREEVLCVLCTHTAHKDWEHLPPSTQHCACSDSSNAAALMPDALRLVQRDHRCPPAMRRAFLAPTRRHTPAQQAPHSMERHVVPAFKAHPRPQRCPWLLSSSKQSSCPTRQLP